MTSQLFKNKVPLDILTTLLKSCCDESYMIGKDAYKKGCLCGAIDIFINNLKDMYFPSKQYYVTRKMSYKNLITIIRQLCNHLNIPYSSKILYNKSSYEIVYYISLDSVLTNVVADEQFPHNGIAF